jgi:hypothetical protein
VLVFGGELFEVSGKGGALLLQGGELGSERF